MQKVVFRLQRLSIKLLKGLNKALDTVLEEDEMDDDGDDATEERGDEA